MNAKDLGAQPIAYTRHTIGGGELGSRTYGSQGLTKRELFAAMVMPELVHIHWNGGNRYAAMAANEAVEYADALLAELAKYQP